MLKASLRRYWPVVAAAVLLFPHALLFDFINDDAYISFRYARNLAQHGELVFNLGERVEGFTNFLWTLLLAGGIKLGISPVVFSRFLGVAFAVGTLGLLVRFSLRLDGERPSRWHAVAPVGMAALGAFACWCTGGLETQLFTFLLLLSFERLLNEMANGRGFISGGCFALAAMTRPEGALLFAVAALYRVARNLQRERRLKPTFSELYWVAAFVVVFVPYFVWRWSYYGWPFPNTFYVKSAGGADTWLRGLHYLRRFAEDYGVGFLALVVALGWPAPHNWRRRDLFELFGVTALVFGLYVVQVGGDFMGLYRFILPILPLGALCVQEAARTLTDRLSRYVTRPVLTAAGITAFAAFVAGSLKVSHRASQVSSDRGIDSPGYLRHYVEERLPVGLWMAQHVRPEHLASVGGAGVIPYYSGIRAFDCYGLVDQTIAHDPRMTVATRPGHQKWPSFPYLFSRKPTLITHVYCINQRCNTDEAFWRSNGYEWVTATIPGLPAPSLYSFLKRIDTSFGPFPASNPAAHPAEPETEKPGGADQ
jgi:arabinofuranosyltransferase